jgi:hypothetical protein
MQIYDEIPKRNAYCTKAHTLHSRRPLGCRPKLLHRSPTPPTPQRRHLACLPYLDSPDVYTGFAWQRGTWWRAARQPQPLQNQVVPLSNARAYVFCRNVVDYKKQTKNVPCWVSEIEKDHKICGLCFVACSTLCRRN